MYNNESSEKTYFFEKEKYVTQQNPLPFKEYFLRNTFSNRGLQWKYQSSILKLDCGSINSFQKFKI